MVSQISDLRTASAGNNHQPSVIAKRAEQTSSVAESRQRDPIRLSRTLTPEHTRQQSLLQRAQQQLASAQVAEQSLLDIGKGLAELNKRLSTAARSSQASHQLEANFEKLTSNLENRFQQAEYQGQSVLSRQLKPIYHGEAQTTFKVRGLDTQRAVNRDEMLVFNLGKGGASAVPVKIPANATPEKQAQQFRQAFNEHGIGVGLDKKRQLVFSSNEGDWERLQKSLKVTGQGERFPAGKANRARVEATQLRFEPTKLKADRQALQSSQAETKQLIQQVKASVQELRDYRRNINEKMANISHQHAILSDLSLESMQKDLQNILPVEMSFTQVYRNIQTQANVHRHTVVALLSR
ncbi:putative flagellin [Vibrio astriarenae]|nr:putative flagellin [Vibrio sp. C7]